MTQAFRASGFKCSAERAETDRVNFAKPGDEGASCRALEHASESAVEHVEPACGHPEARENQPRTIANETRATNGPAPEPDEGRTLILLTRRFRNLPQTERRLYVQPSDEVPADKIDFTDEKKLHETWEFGRKNAQSFLAGEEAQLFSGPENVD